MKNRTGWMGTLLSLFAWLQVFSLSASAQTPIEGPTISLPMGRQRYYVGESILVDLNSIKSSRVKLEIRNEKTRIKIHEGKPTSLWFFTSGLPSGEYVFEVDGKVVDPKIVLRDSPNGGTVLGPLRGTPDNKLPENFVWDNFQTPRIEAVHKSSLNFVAELRNSATFAYYASTQAKPRFQWDTPTLLNPGRSLLIPEKERESQIHLEQIDGGRDVKYVIAIHKETKPYSRSREKINEWLWPTKNLPPTDIIYDCTEEVLHGKAKPILCNLEQMYARVFALLPTQLEEIRIANRGEGQIEIDFCNAAGKRLEGIFPFHMSLAEEDGTVRDESYNTTEIDGVFRFRIFIPPSNYSKRIKSVCVRSQLTGQKSSIVPVAKVATAQDR